MMENLLKLICLRLQVAAAAGGVLFFGLLPMLRTRSWLVVLLCGAIMVTGWKLMLVPSWRELRRLQRKMNQD